MKPYFEDESVTIYHGDCREVLPTLAPVDLVLTDPPYGVGFEYVSHVDSLESRRELIGFLVPWVQRNAQMGILPSCQINQLRWIYTNHPPDWLICWYKGSPGHVAHVGFNDWEPLLVYGKTRGLQMHDYFYARPDPPNGHPCPKPLIWASWMLARIDAKTVLDPFMGSGTTLRAAKDLGRKAIGIEIEERYCEIAAKRMAQGVLL
ncbi:MAG: site-specific DNA-methyltransferase [Patescibacteria group bacterium]|nr:site-specific DNA-methyltransferase [Patescibacteria group bacterium]